MTVLVAPRANESLQLTNARTVPRHPLQPLYGYTAERLKQERAVIAAFEQANQAQVAAIGAAQQATRDQRAALATLSQWVGQYLKIAKIALRSKPELVEKIGGVARSARTAAQRGAPKKAAATRAAKLAA